jgi:hypothetical protein
MVGDCYASYQRNADGSYAVVRCTTDINAIRVEATAWRAPIPATKEMRTVRRLRREARAHVCLLRGGRAAQPLLDALRAGPQMVLLHPTRAVTTQRRRRTHTAAIPRRNDAKPPRSCEHLVNVVESGSLAAVSAWAQRVALLALTGCTHYKADTGFVSQGTQPTDAVAVMVVGEVDV